MKDGAALLGAFLEKHQLNREAFAVRVQSTGASVSRWVNRKRVPTVRQSIKIQKATFGAVPVEAWGLVERIAS